jgi:hypothetical protein
MSKVLMIFTKEKPGTLGVKGEQICWNHSRIQECGRGDKGE